MCASSSSTSASADLIDTAPVTDTPARPVVGPGWSDGTRRRFAWLGVSRVLAQAIGFAWFAYSARHLDAAEFGSLAIGLTLFSLFAGLGDLGTTRTLVRHVADRPEHLWAALTRGIGVRVTGGVVSTLLLAAGLAVGSSRVELVLVVLAGAIATTSGVTELGYAALRSIGAVSTEQRVLIGERIAFLGGGIVVIANGGGAHALLLWYLASNSTSAVIVTAAAARHRVHRITPRGGPRPRLRYLDRLGRDTAAGFTLTTISPRLSAAVLGVVAAPAAVGSFVVAQRPIEAIALLAGATATPLLPIVRRRLAEGRTAEAERAAGSTATALLVLAAPVVSWMLARPADVVSIVAGRSDRPAEVVTRILSLSALTWILRSVGENVLVAHDRPRRALFITGVGTVVTLALAIAVASRGPTAIAITTLVAEVLMTILLVWSLPAFRHGPALIGYLRTAAFGAGTVAALRVLDVRRWEAAAVVGVASGVAALSSLRTLRGLEPDR